MELRYRQAVVIRKPGREIPALRQWPPVGGGNLIEPYRTEETTAARNLMPESGAKRIPRPRPAESRSFCYVPLVLVHCVITEAAITRETESWNDALARCVLRTHPSAYGNVGTQLIAGEPSH